MPMSPNDQRESPLPKIASAVHAGNHRIHLRFKDGVEKTVDCRRWLKGPVFQPLQVVAFFKRFSLHGGSLVWSNGAGIAAAALYGATDVRQLPKARSHGRTATARPAKPGSKG